MSLENGQVQLTVIIARAKLMTKAWEVVSKRPDPAPCRDQDLGKFEVMRMEPLG